MGKSAAAALYQCSECGWRSMKWAGRCGECQGWGTVTEARVPALARAGLRSPGRAGQPVLPGSAAAIPITDIDASSASARPTGLDELDRVLGGGLVPGAVVLLAGEPGVGKSTLLLEAGALAAEAGPVLYVTGEESAAQVRLRADRIGAISKQLYLAAETDLSAVLDHVDAVRPGLLIVDSVQTINVAGIDGTPGGVTQIREVTAALMEVAKRQMLTIVLVGHVTKDGSIAGPRALEHLVDVVLHFDGDRHSQLRMVRALKNRFGPTDEIGCFELGEYGLIGLADPSGLFLSQVREPVPGTCVTVALEGRRPLVAEVQTLVCASTLDMARRVTSGLDASRVGMVLAVLQRRAGVTIGKQDVYAATVGGVRLTEPSVDLAVALAVASATSELSVPPHLVAIGEVGLAGEIRRVPGMQRRLAEAERMGFRTAIVPPGSGGLPDGRGVAAAGPGGPGTASGLPGAADGAGPGRPGSGQLTDVREARDIREAIAAALGR
jgi:DNA repair protein RadA/Sms